jgi:hypothetical protein
MLAKLSIPQGKSLYFDAPFDVRRRLSETFKHFNVSASREVVGESLLRLERVCRKSKRFNPAPMKTEDNNMKALFAMLTFYKSLQ